jgi:hypothetical protein
MADGQEVVSTHTTSMSSRRRWSDFLYFAVLSGSAQLLRGISGSAPTVNQTQNRSEWRGSPLTGEAPISDLPPARPEPGNRLQLYPMAESWQSRESGGAFSVAVVIKKTKQKSKQKNKRFV